MHDFFLNPGVIKCKENLNLKQMGDGGPLERVPNMVPPGDMMGPLVKISK